MVNLIPTCIVSGRRREHPKDTSKGDLRSLRVLRNFRLCILKGTPKGSSNLRSHPVILLRKKRGGKAGYAEPTSVQGHFRTGRVPGSLGYAQPEVAQHP
jgi:hypothetical protein